MRFQDRTATAGVIKREREPYWKSLLISTYFLVQINNRKLHNLCLRWVYKHHMVHNPKLWWLSGTIGALVKDRSRRPGGVNGSWSKISSKFKSSAYVPKSPEPSSVLTKVWSSYWKVKPTQKSSNEQAKPRSKSEANRENSWSEQPGPVWPVAAVQEQADRSDRSCLPVWPVAPRKPPRNWIQTVNPSKRPWKSMKFRGLLRPYPWTYHQKISS